MAEIVNVATFKQILLTHTTKCTLSITLHETGHWQIPHPLNLQGLKLRRRHEHETCTRFEVLGFRIVHMELIVSGVNGEGGIFIVEAVFRGHELSMIYILSGVWYVSTLLWGVQQVSVGRGLYTYSLVYNFSWLLKISFNYSFVVVESNIWTSSVF